MLNSPAAHFESHVTLDSYSVTVAESHTSVASVGDERSTKHKER